MLRTLGQNPTDAELQELIDSVDGDGGEKDGKIQLREFLTLYANAIEDDGQPMKAKAGKEDAANVFTSMGGDRQDKASRISSDLVKSTLVELFELPVNLKVSSEGKRVWARQLLSERVEQAWYGAWTQGADAHRVTETHRAGPTL